MSTLFKDKKSIFKTIFIFISVNKKVFLKKKILTNLSSIKNLNITILYILRIELSIFGTSILINYVKKFNLVINIEFIVLILLLKSISTLK